jgi:cyclohexa-1,5-dienecarbonyl-CoA hydratase
MPEETIHYALEDQIARITLDRPPLNVLDIRMTEALNVALDQATAHPALRALVVTGTGKAFCAGVAVEDHLGERARPMLDAFHGVFRRMQALDCITIAAVRGAALGGGAELATFCDVVIAADDATFGQPEIKVGVFPPIAALHYPHRIGYPKTLQLLTSGEILTAADAVRVGLADRVVPAEKLADAVEVELGRYRKLSIPVLRITKRAVRAAHGVDFAEGLATLEELYHTELMTTADAEEGLRAFVEKRKPVWKDR